MAQLVDGSLGMGYGVTSSALLVLAGLTPVAASASVHFSELGTNLASGVSHWRLRNVDWPVVARIAGPGAVGAFLGATVSICAVDRLGKTDHVGDLGAARDPTSSSVSSLASGRSWRRATHLKFLAPLGLFAGFVDATGGGGWGPVRYAGAAQRRAARASQGHRVC